MLNPPLPEAFIHAIMEDSPFGAPLLNALEQECPTSIRTNPRKAHAFETKDFHRVPWCNNGFYLDQRPNFTLDPLFHAGVYYPQEAASMVIGEVVRQLPLPDGVFVLDSCAAPGGKTTAMFDALPPDSSGIANEIHPHRANILNETVTKWGLNNVAVTQNDTAAFKPMVQMFDLVLVDAPCSGEGMFRKDPNARLEWNDNSPRYCAERQCIIVNNLIESVKEGGYMIYATCTFNRQENEEIIQYVLDQHGFELVSWQPAKACVTGRNGLGFYFAPGFTQSEGLYLCVLRKKGVLTGEKKENSPKRIKDFTGFNLVLNDNEALVQEGNLAVIRSSSLGKQLQRIKSPLRYVKRGVIVAEATVKGWVPQHDFALYSDSFQAIDCTKHEALMYLRGETFPIPPYTQGYYTLRHQGVNLGFIKHLGTRFNNMYPKPWRIRMQLS